MTVDGVQENDSRIQNEEHDHPATAKRVKIVDSIGGDITSTNKLPVDAAITGGAIYSVPPFTITKTYVGNQTNETLVTPTAGKQLQIIGVLITSDDSLFTCKVEFLTSEQTVQQHFEQGTLGSYIPSNIKGSVDEVLTLNIASSASQNWFMIINYAEIDP